MFSFRGVIKTCYQCNPPRLFFVLNEKKKKKKTDFLKGNTITGVPVVFIVALNP